MNKRTAGQVTRLIDKLDSDHDKLELKALENQDKIGVLSGESDEISDQLYYLRDALVNLEELTQTKQITALRGKLDAEYVRLADRKREIWNQVADLRKVNYDLDNTIMSLLGASRNLTSLVLLYGPEPQPEPQSAEDEPARVEWWEADGAGLPKPSVVKNSILGIPVQRGF